MSEEYYLAFQERFPGSHALGMGMVIGMLSAIAVSSGIALAQFASGAPWKELLASWGMTVALMAPTFAAAFGAGFLAHHYRRANPPLSAFRLPVTTETVASSHCTVSVGQQSLAVAVVQNANDQAFWHYERGREPTRRAMELQGVSQTVWNSGRHILTTAKIVEGKEWAPEPLEVIERVLDNIRAEHDRVWIRPLGGRSMICLHIDKQAVNKRYTHPTPPAREPEHGENQTRTDEFQNRLRT